VSVEEDLPSPSVIEGHASGLTAQQGVGVGVQDLQAYLERLTTHVYPKQALLALDVRVDRTRRPVVVIER